MVYEFEGKTEKEAIDYAVDQLGIEANQFDVEILETQKSGLFNLSKKVKIKVHPHVEVKPVKKSTYNPDPENDIEHGIVDFIQEATEKMGFPAKAEVQYREDNRLGVKLVTDHAGILIGKKGKNLDALQVLTNSIAGKLMNSDFKVILDSENYRARREESLIRLAQKIGDQVMRTRKSRLLDPMNPFERRIIHTTLAAIDDIDTKSEGEGLYKQVRISYRSYT